MTRTLRMAGAFTAGVLLLAACADAAANQAGDDPSTTEVVGVDFGFEAPDTVPVGTTLTFRNASDVEYHEVAVLRVADGETRSPQDLLELPGDEAGEVLEFVGVATAFPGSTGEVLQGSLTLTVPGRYVLTCFVPQGADPEVVHAAFHAAEDGPPPDLGDGAPHAFLGMIGELLVE